ncbi:hypothetical protein HK105_207517 [Polyrhizophydium stewartii]|uniref:Uncharacterized protein n=1 Tax=Polyrhizophydium stewartii TaxID=2732419 RepID=A0ABR4N0A1_9FUNG
MDSSDAGDGDLGHGDAVAPHGDRHGSGERLGTDRPAVRVVSVYAGVQGVYERSSSPGGGGSGGGSSGGGGGGGGSNADLDDGIEDLVAAAAASSSVGATSVRDMPLPPRLPPLGLRAGGTHVVKTADAVVRAFGDAARGADLEALDAVAVGATAERDECVESIHGSRASLATADRGEQADRTGRGDHADDADGHGADEGGLGDLASPVRPPPARSGFAGGGGDELADSAGAAQVGVTADPVMAVTPVDPHAGARAFAAGRTSSDSLSLGGAGQAKDDAAHELHGTSDPVESVTAADLVYSASELMPTDNDEEQLEEDKQLGESKGQIHLQDTVRLAQHIRSMTADDQGSGSDGAEEAAPDSDMPTSPPQLHKGPHRNTVRETIVGSVHSVHSFHVELGAAGSAASLPLRASATAAPRISAQRRAPASWAAEGADDDGQAGEAGQHAAPHAMDTVDLVQPVDAIIDDLDGHAGARHRAAQPNARPETQPEPQMDRSPEEPAPQRPRAVGAFGGEAGASGDSPAHGHPAAHTDAVDAVSSMHNLDVEPGVLVRGAAAYDAMYGSRDRQASVHSISAPPTPTPPPPPQVQPPRPAAAYRFIGSAAPDPAVADQSTAARLAAHEPATVEAVHEYDAADSHTNAPSGLVIASRDGRIGPPSKPYEPPSAVQSPADTQEADPHAPRPVHGFAHGGAGDLQPVEAVARHAAHHVQTVDAVDAVEVFGDDDDSSDGQPAAQARVVVASRGAAPALAPAAHSSQSLQPAQAPPVAVQPRPPPARTAYSSDAPLADAHASHAAQHGRHTADATDHVVDFVHDEGGREGSGAPSPMQPQANSASPAPAPTPAPAPATAPAPAQQTHKPRDADAPQRPKPRAWAESDTPAKPNQVAPQPTSTKSPTDGVSPSAKTSDMDKAKRKQKSGFARRMLAWLSCGTPEV